MKKIVFAYITNPSRKMARKIAQHLLKKRLIACTNVFSSDSLYWWQDKIADEKEFVLIAKTLEKNFKKVKSEIEKIHPYTVPCIIKIPVSANEKYFKWLISEIRSQHKRYKKTPQ